MLLPLAVMHSICSFKTNATLPNRCLQDNFIKKRPSHMQVKRKMALTSYILCQCCAKKWHGYLIFANSGGAYFFYCEELHSRDLVPTYPHQHTQTAKDHADGMI